MKLYRNPAVEPTSGEFDALTKSIKDISSKADTFATKDELNTINKALGDIRTQITVKENVQDDPNWGFKNLGEYAQAVMKVAENGGNIQYADERLKTMTKANEVTQAYDPSVGFLFPRGFVAELELSWGNPDNLLAGTKRIPIDPGQQFVEVTVVDDQDRSGGSVAGGVTAYWKDELTQMSNTRPKLRQIRLEPHELYAYSVASDKSLRNAPIALGAFLSEQLVQSVNFKIGDALINGDGAAKPLGLLANGSAISVAKETSQTAATINEVNLAKMWKRMPANLRSSAVWLCNQDVEDQFDLMARAAYGASATINPNIDTILYNRANNTLKGRPIVYTEYCPTLGTVGDIILWNPGSYYTATKSGQGPETSMHFYFDTAKTAFRFIFEVDGKSRYNTVFTPYKGSTTRSDIVTLATRS